MKVKRIRLTNFRNYSEADLHLNEDLNVLIGNNAQGKTNLLEAIGLIVFGKSHRNSKELDMIRWGCQEFNINIDLTYAGMHKEIIYNYKDGKKEIKVNGIHIQKIGELIGNLVAVIFSPDDLTIVKEGPQERRRFLDMMLSQMYSGYFYDLQLYTRILKNRNALLKEISQKSSLKDTLDIWDCQIASTGSKIITRRNNFVNQLSKLSETRHVSFSKGKENLSIKYNTFLNDKGFKTQKETEEKIKNLLQKNRNIDLFRCFTSIGPHRDDIEILLNGKSLREFGSQGQQRSSVLSLKFSLMDLIFQELGEYPILLLDDVMSELDEERKEYILTNMVKWQTIITTTKDTLQKFSSILNTNIFTIIQGKVFKT